MRDAIGAAHGRGYTLKQSVSLYPTSGTSDDYAYPRSFLDSSKNTVLGYTIEWGPQRSSIPKSFHPDYPDIAWPAWKAAVIAPLETLIRDQAPGHK
jgi:carboxypeptidase T